MSMTDNHKPTCKLRFFHTTRNGKYTIVLQQLFTSDYADVKDEWRDIPVVKG